MYACSAESVLTLKFSVIPPVLCKNDLYNSVYVIVHKEHLFSLAQGIISYTP